MSKTLKELFGNDFDLGAAVNAETVVSHSELLKANFTSVTCENEMKFISTHPERGVYTFERADMITDFASANGMKARGHTLVWHNQTPDWVFSDSAETLPIVTEHINTLLGRYKGKVYCYDVVNEAVSDAEGELLRPTKWLQALGGDYIDKVFMIAHEADPGALLFYNDYNESVPEKRDKIYGLLKGMIGRGVPVHGLGLQAHWNIYGPSEDEITAAIEKYAGLGLILHITELDISAYASGDERTGITEPEDGVIEKIISKYEKVFAIFKQYKSVIKSVTTWGAADDCTWLDQFPVRNRKNWPLLFDTNHRLKAWR